MKCLGAVRFLGPATRTTLLEGRTAMSCLSCGRSVLGRVVTGGIRLGKDIVLGDFLTESYFVNSTERSTVMWKRDLGGRPC